MSSMEVGFIEFSVKEIRSVEMSSTEIRFNEIGFNENSFNGICSTKVSSVKNSPSKVDSKKFCFTEIGSMKINLGIPIFFSPLIPNISPLL